MGFFQTPRETLLRHPHDNETPQYVDIDFKYLKKILEFPKEAWLTEVKTHLLKIYRKKDTKIHSSSYMFKSLISLPEVPKMIAFKVIQDINERRKWDQIMKDVTIIEQDPKNLTSVFAFPIPVPHYIRPREALVRLKTLKNWPDKKSHTIFISSVTRDDFPANPEKVIRVDLTVSAFVISDDF